MKIRQNKPIIGLTGGVGSGKTTVAQQFAKLGCAVIDADELGHELLTRQDIIQQLKKWWGLKVLGHDGQVRRDAVGAIVFQEDQELKKLTDLLHPLIAGKEKELLESYNHDPEVVAIVLDVPLLFESGQDKWCDFTIFVEAEDEIRYERVKKRKKWEVETTKKVQKKHLALDMKRKLSDHIVRNNSSIPDLAEQTAKIFSLVFNNFQRKIP